MPAGLEALRKRSSALQVPGSACLPRPGESLQEERLVMKVPRHGSFPDEDRLDHQTLIDLHSPSETVKRITSISFGSGVEVKVTVADA